MLLVKRLGNNDSPGKNPEPLTPISSGQVISSCTFANGFNKALGLRPEGSKLKGLPGRKVQKTEFRTKLSQICIKLEYLGRPRVSWKVCVGGAGKEEQK